MSFHLRHVSNSNLNFGQFKPRIKRGLFFAIFLAGMLLATLLAGAAKAYQPPAELSVEYLALGDSYSAGNGAYSLTNDEDYYGDNPCHRSRYTYSEQIKDWYESSNPGVKVNYKNRACMGWVTSQVSNLIDQPGVVTPDIDLITLTIGGNDAQFSKVVINCMLNTDTVFSASCIEKLVNADQQLTDITAKTQSILTKLRQKAPNAQIVLLGYPMLIGNCEYQKELYVSFTNHVLGANLEYLGQQYPNIKNTQGESLKSIANGAYQGGNLELPVGNVLRSMQQRLNSAQQSMVSRLGQGFYYQSVDFSGHELMCNYSNEYLNNIEPPLQLYAGFVHPKAVGHSVYRDAVVYKTTALKSLLSGQQTVTGIMSNAIILDPTDPNKRSYFLDDTMQKHHIPDKATFDCIYGLNHDVFHVSQNAINSVKEGTEARCSTTIPSYLSSNSTPTLLRTIENDQTIVHMNGAYYRVPDASTFNCYGGWNNTIIVKAFLAPNQSLPVISNADAHCFSGEKMIVKEGASSYLVFNKGKPSIDPTVTNGTVAPITSIAEYQCLVASGIPVQNISSSQLRFYYQGSSQDIKCFNDAIYQGKIVVINGKNYFVAINGTSKYYHYVADAETYNCLTRKGHPLLGTVEAVYISKYVKEGGAATCFDDTYYGGKIIDFGTNAKYFIAITNGKRTYHHIADASTYNCLVGRGHPDIGKQLESYIKRNVSEGNSAGCYDESYWVKNIVVHGGKSYFIYPGNILKPIAWQGDYNCFVSKGAKVRQNVESSYLIRYFRYTSGEASCYDDKYYNNAVVTISGSGASYYVRSGTLQHIASTSDFYCALQRPGAQLRQKAELGYLLKNLRLVSGNIACKTSAQLANKAARDSSGTYWFTNANGYRYRMTNWVHEHCLKTSYGDVGYVDTLDIQKFTLSSATARCYEVDAYANRFIHYAGTIYYVEPSGIKRAINSWDRYLCQQRKVGGSYINVGYSTISRLPSGAVFDYCTNEGVRNAIIREPNGTAWWINSYGQRFHIPDGGTWNCFGGWGRVALDWITPETRNSYQYVSGSARCYGGILINNRVIRHVNGDCHFVDSAGNRHWLGSIAAYWRYVNAYGGYISVTRSYINSLPQSYHLY